MLSLVQESSRMSLPQHEDDHAVHLLNIGTQQVQGPPLSLAWGGVGQSTNRVKVGRVKYREGMEAASADLL